MRLIKNVLILVLLAVTALYAWQRVSTNLTDAKEPPVIECPAEPLVISVADAAETNRLLAGVTASDAQDGDLTNDILVAGVSKLITENTAKITYVVFDSDNNMASATRSVRYTDYHCPRFSLSEPLVYTFSQEILLLDRLQALDVIDGDITNAIRVSQMLATSDSEIYAVDVQVTNSMGDTAWLSLPVILLEGGGDRVEITLSSYLVYLEKGSGFHARNYLESATFAGETLDLENVHISGQVDTNTPGVYQVQYDAAYAGNAGKIILTVVVE